jgi:DNA polymerase-3 subunit alpha
MENKYDFCHLHRHCEASVQDGAGKIEDGIKYAKEMGHKAVAITDHGNLISFVRMFNQAQDIDIKHIFGLEAYVCDDMNLKDKDHRSYNHCTILVKNQQGFQNLLKLNNAAQKHGFYYRPRVDWDTLLRHKEGLIILSGCVLGKTAQLILNGKYEEADAWTRMMKAEMGDDYYIELMASDYPAQKDANKYLLELSEKYQIPGVLTGDAHYVRKEDYEAQKTMMLMSAKATLADLAKQEEEKKTAEERGETFDEKDKIWIFSSDQYWMKNENEMIESWDKWHKDYYPFEKFEQHLNESGKIADKVDVVKLDTTYKVPKAIVPEGYTHENYFIKLLNEAMIEKGLDTKQEYQERLATEIEIIKEKGLVDYFLVNADIIGWAKRNDIFVGPARGSAGGSLVCWLLKITEIDPLKYDLLFERFLDLGRKEMPDIDTDFEIEERDRVKDYISSRYGEDHVANIAALGNFRAKNIIRDVCRVYNYDPQEVNAISKELGEHATFENGKLYGPDGQEIRSQILDEVFTKNPAIKRISETLYGQIRHISRHAAGVVITDRPLDECIATIRVGDDVMTAWTDGIYNKELSQLNVLKLDILGLKTLSMLKKACAFAGFSYRDLPTEDLEDKEVYETINDLELLSGVFQFDSHAGSRWFKKMKPQCFNDIVALAALDRPGPIDSGKTEEYIKVMHGEIEQTKFNHPAVSEILDPTYGAIVYQEQLMILGKRFAGFTAAEASTLRKNLVKGTHSEAGKTKEALQRIELHNKFISGAVANGSTEEDAEAIWDLMVTFARYGFNKAHSVAYALVSYWTMWMKVHYPREFYASLLSYSPEEDLHAIVKEMKRINIQLAAPDVNISNYDFTPNKEEASVLFGLGKIKFLGNKAIEKIIELRPFTSFEEMCEKIEKRVLNKRGKEALIRSSALRSLEKDTGLLLQQLNQQGAKKNEIIRYEEYSDATRYDDERTYLGLSVSFADREEDKGSKFKSYNNITMRKHPLYEELLAKFQKCGGKMPHAVTARVYDYTSAIIADIAVTKNRKNKDQKIVTLRTIDDKTIKFILQNWVLPFHAFNKEVFKGDCIEILYEKQGQYYQLISLRKRE